MFVQVGATWPEAQQWFETKLGREMEIDGQRGKLTSFLIETLTPHEQQNEMYIAMRPYHDRYPTYQSGDEILFCAQGGVEMGEAETRTDLFALKVPLLSKPTAEDIKGE
jgi:hypothetical protein